jgi:hypothetical protein
MQKLITSFYRALQLSRNDFSVLKNVLTFDHNLWRLILHSASIYRINGRKLAMAINKCDDPMQFRLLAKLAGGLALGICVAPLCRRFLARQGSLDRRFSKLREVVTPLRVVVRRALGAMPTDVGLNGFAEGVAACAGSHP